MPSFLAFRGPEEARCGNLPASIVLNEQRQKELQIGRNLQSHDPNFLHVNTAPGNPFFNALSRTHACFTFVQDGGHWVVVDARSRFGVHVNNHRLEPELQHPLQHGDKIVFGPNPSRGAPNPISYEYLVQEHQAQLERGIPNEVNLGITAADHQPTLQAVLPEADQADVDRTGYQSRTDAPAATGKRPRKPSVENSVSSKATKPRCDLAGENTIVSHNRVAAVRSATASATEVTQTSAEEGRATHKRPRGVPETIGEAMDWLAETLSSGACGSVPASVQSLFIDNARESEVNGEILRDLTLDDLQHLGLRNLGMRKKLLKCISELFVTDSDDLVQEQRNPFTVSGGHATEECGATEQGNTIATPSSKLEPQTPTSAMSTVPRLEQPGSELRSGKPVQLSGLFQEQCENGDAEPEESKDGRRKLSCGDDASLDEGPARKAPKLAPDVFEKQIKDVHELEAARIRVAGTLQKIWRGHQSRIVCARLRSVILLEATFQKRQDRCVFLSRKTATIALQAMMRRASASETYQFVLVSFATLHGAARRFQSCIAFIACKRAAVVMQSAWRGYVEKTRLRLAKHSAVVTQAAYRGFIERAMFRQVRQTTCSLQAAMLRATREKEYQVGRHSAIIIQAVHRGRKAREQLRCAMRVAVKLQAAFRGFIARSRFRSAKRSAVTLQKTVRGYRQKQVFTLLKRTQFLLAAVVQGRQQLTSYARLRRAVVTLQTSVRAKGRRRDAVSENLDEATQHGVSKALEGKAEGVNTEDVAEDGATLEYGSEEEEDRTTLEDAKEGENGNSATVQGGDDAEDGATLEWEDVEGGSEDGDCTLGETLKQPAEDGDGATQEWEGNAEHAENADAGEDGATLEWEDDDEMNEDEDALKGSALEQQAESKTGNAETEKGETAAVDGATLEYESEEDEVGMKRSTLERQEQEKTATEQAEEEAEDGATLEWEDDEGGSEAGDCTTGTLGQPAEGEDGATQEWDGNAEKVDDAAEAAEDGATLEWGDGNEINGEEDGSTKSTLEQQAESKTGNAETEQAEEEAEDGATLEWEDDEGGSEAGDCTTGTLGQPAEGDGGATQEWDGNAEKVDDAAEAAEDGATLEWGDGNEINGEEDALKGSTLEQAKDEEDGSASFKADDTAEDGAMLESEGSNRTVEADDVTKGVTEGGEGGATAALEGNAGKDAAADVNRAALELEDVDETNEADDGTKATTQDQAKGEICAKQCGGNPCQAEDAPEDAAGDAAPLDRRTSEEEDGTKRAKPDQADENGKGNVAAEKDEDTSGASPEREEDRDANKVDDGTKMLPVDEAEGVHAGEKEALDGKADITIHAAPLKRVGDDEGETTNIATNNEEAAAVSHTEETGGFAIPDVQEGGQDGFPEAAKGSDLESSGSMVIDLATNDNPVDGSLCVEPVSQPVRKKHPVVCKLSQKVKDQMRREEDCVSHGRWAIDQAEKLLRDASKPWASRELKAAKLSELSNIRQTMKVPGSSLIVFGDSGSGKSTLINSLLGEKEIIALVDDLTQDDGRCSMRKPDDGCESRRSWDKLWSVYGKHFTRARDGERPMLSTDLKRVLMTHVPTRNRLGTLKRVTSDFPETFRRKMNKFMDSGDRETKGQLWPLVRVVKLQSRSWKALQTGTTIIDAPGVNDDNSARDGVVKQRLRDADGVIIVANMTRACDNKTARDMLSESFRRQLLMDGQYGQLCFVATKSDVFKQDEVIRTCDLPVDASLEQCAEKWKEYVRNRIENDFYSGLEEMQRRAGVAELDSDSLRQKHTLDVHCVSAVEYQKLTGIIDVEVDGAATVFSELEATGIPDMMQFIHRTTLKRRYTTVRQNAEGLANFFSSIEAVLNDQGSTEAAFQRTARDLVHQISARVATELENHLSTLDDAIKHLFDVELGKLLTSGASNAARACVPAAELFAKDGDRNLHFMTYFATCRRDGVFKQDWNVKLAEPVFRAVSVQWEQIFCTGVANLLAALASNCRAALKVAHDSISAELNQVDGNVLRRLTEMRKPQEKDASTKLAHMVAVATEEITKQQRELSRVVAPHVQQTMQGGYHAARQETGKGVAERRKAIVVEHARKNCSMFEGIVAQIMKDLTSIRGSVAKTLKAHIHAVCQSIPVNYSPLWSNSNHRAVIACKQLLLQQLERPVHQARADLANLLRVHDDLNPDDFEGIELIEPEPAEVIDLEDGSFQVGQLPVSLAVKREPKNDPVRIVVYGPSGAGKSSMLNAVVGEPDLLPTNGMRACTATIIEVRHNKQPGAERYRAEVEFVSSEEWETELSLLFTAMKAAAPESSGEQRLPEDGTRAHEALSKVRAAYGASVSLELGVRGLMALGGAVANHLGTVVALTATTASALRDQYAVYADSQADATAAALWPLVKKITLHGPWSLLASGRGVILVDAPGVGDENSARDARVQHDLEQADAVWLCSGVTRAVNDAAIKKVITRQFKRLLVQQGVTGSLCFVVTCTDSGLRSEMQDNFRMPRESSRLECILRRNADVKDRLLKEFGSHKKRETTDSMQTQLGSLSEMAQDAQFELKTFTVSAVEFQKIVASAQDGSENVFENAEQTEIPNLQRMVCEIANFPCDGRQKIGSLLLETKAQSLEADGRATEEMMEHDVSDTYTVSDDPEEEGEEEEEEDDEEGGEQ